MSLPRKARTGIFDKVMVDVWDIKTKTIVFTGSQGDAAKFAGASGSLSAYLSRKVVFQKKYAFRISKRK